MGFTIKKPKKLQIPRKISFFIIWWQKIGSTITKPKKLQIPREISLYNFYSAAISTITKPKKLQISRKISFYFILGGEKLVLPSRSQKNYKSRVKFLFILYGVAKMGSIIKKPKKYWAAKNRFYHHEAKKTTNPT